MPSDAERGEGKTLLASHTQADIPDAPLDGAHYSIDTSFSDPVQCRIKDALSPKHPKLGDVCLTYAAQRAASSDGTRVCIAHIVSAPRTNSRHAHLDVYDTRLGSLVRTFRFADLAQRVEVLRRKNEHRENLQSLCFIGNDLLVVGTETGRLRVLSIADGSVRADVRVGGSIATVACSSSHLAASIFPCGTSAAYERSCGIKVYPTEPIIARAELAATCHVLHSALSFLPNVIQFNSDGTELLCRGANTTEGDLNETIELNNLIVAYSIVTGAVQPILSELDTYQVHCVSNAAADGSYVVVGKESIYWHDRHHNEIWRCKRPRFSRGRAIDCHLCESRNLLIYDDPYAATIEFGKPRARSLMRHGRILYIHEMGERGMLAFIDRGGRCVPTMLSHSGLDVLEPKPGQRAEIQRTIPNGIAVGRDGRLYLADSEGHVRVYSSNLQPLQRFPSGRGVITEIVADPFADRLAMLSASGAVLAMPSSARRPSVYVSNSSGRRVERGNRRIVYPTGEPGELMFGQSRAHEWVRITNTRSAETSVSTHHRTVEIEDYDWQRHAWTRLHEFTMPAAVCRGVELRGWVLLALEDGSLVALNPHGATVKGCQRGCTDFRESHDCIRVLDGLERPCDLYRVPDVGVVVRTAESLVYLQFAEDFRVVNQRACDGRGVKNVVFDRSANRFIVCYETRLSFLSKELDEMYRHYLVGGGRQIVHVPFPPHLRRGADEAHPGYLAGDLDCLKGPLDVPDPNGNRVTREGLRRSFVRAHVNEPLVRQAVEDYTAFCCHCERKEQRN